MLESALGLAILLLEGLAVFALAAVGYGVYALTHPARRTYAHAVARGRPGHPGEIPGAPRSYESWTFRSRGRDLPVWDLPGDAPDGPVVIFSHGWGDSRIGGLTRAPVFLAAASRVVMWDMPGHGEAKGTCALGTREVEDLLALLDRVDDGGRGIVLFGWSLGAGVSIAAAAEYEGDGPARDGRALVGDAAESEEPSLARRARRARVIGVIAEAPYRLAPTPARNVMRLRGLPYRWNVGAIFAVLGVDLRVGVKWRGFDRAGHAVRLACPLLVLHGEHDAVCPVADGREIGAAAKQGEFVEVRGGQHFGLWTEEPARDVCAAAVRGFIERLQERRSPHRDTEKSRD